MKKIFLVLFIALTVFVLSGCEYAQEYNDENFFGRVSEIMTTKKHFEKMKQGIESKRELLKELGLAGDVKLLELGRERAIEGKFRGGFLSGTSGEIKTYSTVIFRWKAIDGRSFYAELPVTEIAIENTEGSPKAHFIFEISRCYSPWWQRGSTVFRKKPNLLIDSETVFQATIKISEEDIKKYLAFK